MSMNLLLVDLSEDGGSIADHPRRPWRHRPLSDILRERQLSAGEEANGHPWIFGRTKAPSSPVESVGSQLVANLRVAET